MAVRLTRWLVALVLLGTLAGSLPSSPTRAQDPAAGPGKGQAVNAPSDEPPTETPSASATATATETATPTATLAGTETATAPPTETATPEPTATATETATTSPDASPAVEEPAATPSPTTPVETATATGSPAPTVPGTASATATATDTPDGVVGAATTQTATPTKTPTTTPTATPGQPISLADIVVTVSCRRNPEVITIANTGRRSVYVNSVETMYAPVRGEPFVLEERLRPGRTLTLEMGSQADGRVLTKDAIFTNSAYEQDGLILGLSIGTIARRCPAADPDATPAPEPTQTAVTKSVAIVTTATSLRGSPRSSSPTIRTLAKGTTIATTGMSYGGYVSVAYLATRGWVRASDISFTLPKPPSGQPATTTDDVNLRSGPSTGASVLTVLPSGTRVTYTGKTQGGFKSVAYQGMTGWVYADYLSVQAAGQERWIDVNRTTGAVTLYKGTTKVATYAADVSADASSHGFLATAIGSYTVFAMVAPLSYTPYGDSYIRYWVGFDPNRENGFHSWEMDSSGRTLPEASRATSGCVSTPLTIAKAIFDFAELGMRVEVHW